jgi:hypothetical protein
MLIAQPNVTTKMIMVAADGNGSLYGYAIIYTDTYNYVGVVNLFHTSEGIYQGDWTFTNPGCYFVFYQLYIDFGHTAPADYDRSMEYVEVSNSRAEITATSATATATLSAVGAVQADVTAIGLSVATLLDNTIRTLGLLHENTVVDSQTYDGSGYLLTSRIRSYNSKANANTAGLTGLLYTWTMTASYTGANLTNFKIVAEP